MRTLPSLCFFYHTFFNEFRNNIKRYLNYTRFFNNTQKKNTLHPPHV